MSVNKKWFSIEYPSRSGKHRIIFYGTIRAGAVMVIFGNWKDYTLSISLKPNSLTISLQRARESQVYSYDGEGRLWTAMLEGISYRRGLNGKTVAKWQEGGGRFEGGRNRRWLNTEESSGLEERARLIIANLLADLRGQAVSLREPFPGEWLPVLERAACFDAPRYRQDVAQYHQVYKPVGILPPDQYMAVVLQATEGCSFNTCTFCDFYRDRRFLIKQRDVFAEHARAVHDYLGRGLNLRRTIFLGDANALVIPMPRLIELIDVVHQVYDVEQLGGLYAFLDGFSGEKKSAGDYALLAKKGMKRIYIGMESGSADLLKLLKKPGHPEDVVQAVRAIKAGGVSVGVIVLLGAGGKTYARAHVRDTIAAVNAMELDLDDLIYFSELIEREGLEYTRDAYEHGLSPLTTEGRIEQGAQIEAGLRFRAGGGSPHISRYDIREFVY
jgi:hypothetical protein